MYENELNGFICPKCKNVTTGKVIDSRQMPYGRRRRRVCDKCNGRFTTIETCVTIMRTYGSNSYGNKKA